MSLHNTKKALFQAFIDHTDIDEAHIAVPNVSFTPPQDEIWARLNFIPNQPEVGTLGDAGLDDVTGIFQIDLNMVQGQGDEDLLAMAQCALDYFTAGRYFKYQGQCVKIVSAGFKNGFETDSFYRVMLTISWFAQLTRNINSNK
ncbi:MAG: hypothetical protein CMI54_06330 [Parcubacteria group bacterium]|jgi:hypothetical protein|nr:hypothetical protein [Parcubacteria group bacterium]|tara:strand:- start:4236 stop:4667 length:432 start_codon:yes stop_codon:yes gene_type:complete